MSAHFIYIFSLFLALLLIYNRLIEGINLDERDPLSEYFKFLGTYFLDSLCPERFPSVRPGRLYYPLGFYSFCFFIARFIVKFIPVDHDKFLSTWFPDDNKNISAALFVLFIFNIIVFPFLTFVLISIIIQSLSIPLFYSLPLVAFSFLSIDQLFPRKSYLVNTRSIGYFSTVLLLFIINIYFNSSFISFGVFSSELVVPRPTYDLMPYFVSISISLLLIVVTRSSQQGSQLTFGLIISSVLFASGNHWASLIACSSLFAVLLQLQFPKLDTIPYYITHFYNRYHELTWSLRTYGKFRYAIKTIPKQWYGKLINIFLSFNTESNFYPIPLHKRNWLILLLINRVYLYTLLLFVGSIMAPEVAVLSTSLPYLLMLVSSSIFPAILCNFRPFQGYGPPNHYLDFFSSFAWIFLFRTLYEFSSLFYQSKFYSFIFYFVCSEIVVWIILNYSRLMITLFSSSVDRSTNSSLFLTRIPPFSEFIPIGLRNLSKFILESKFSTETYISCFEYHYQNPIESLLFMRYRYSKSQSVYNTLREDQYLVPLLPMVDSKSYSFYNDCDHFTYRLSSSLINKPQIIVLNLAIPKEVQFLKLCNRLSQFKFQYLKMSDSIIAIYSSHGFSVLSKFVSR